MKSGKAGGPTELVVEIIQLHAISWSGRGEEDDGDM